MLVRSSVEQFSPFSGHEVSHEIAGLTGRLLDGLRHDGVPGFHGSVIDPILGTAGLQSDAHECTADESHDSSDGGAGHRDD
ncbi:hypothetical protein ACFFX0_07295 [Citricoccus parietis]|uniref:Uncharacterized protein n=1 Tax=Citricoccus parietis TaxID=592307 RepID=A0ABV5FXP7_9MICC